MTRSLLGHTLWQYLNQSFSRTFAPLVQGQWASCLSSQWGENIHSISLATINIRDFLNLQIQYSNTLKSIFVEIQKYYGQPSRCFYAKLLQNIKALEGKQTFKTLHVDHRASFKGGIKLFHPANTPTHQSFSQFYKQSKAWQHFLIIMTSALCGLSTSWSDQLGLL